METCSAKWCAGGLLYNTGIGDAVNLAWKLAAVIQRRATDSILDTYETERITFARSLVVSTDKLFRLMVGRSATGEFMREVLVPHLFPFLFGFSAVRAAAFRFISQTRISYHESPLSVGQAGAAQAGDRLPWTAMEDGLDNYAPLQSLDWQLHCYGSAVGAMRTAAERTGLQLNEFPWTDTLGTIGLERDAIYLIRPDGYIGYADTSQDPMRLCSYLNRFGIAPKPV